LLAHGLIRASFVPDTQTQEMRNLLRTRKQLVREQSSHVLRVQKTLEDANIKLDSVLTDLMGKSGRAMIEALIAGETNPVKLASLADRRVKASPGELREALRGRVTKHHRFLLRLHLNQIDAPVSGSGRNSPCVGIRMFSTCRSRAGREAYCGGATALTMETVHSSADPRHGFIASRNSRLAMVYEARGDRLTYATDAAPRPPIGRPSNSLVDALDARTISSV
jgi:hypothetical protein